MPTSLLAGARSAGARGVDDVGYLVALLDEAATRLPLDPKRLFVSGHSNGSQMAYRFAAEQSGRVAALGVVAGHCFAQPVALDFPIPLLQITGEFDPFVPLVGGTAGIGRRTMQVPPAIEAPERWAALLDLPPEPDTLRDDDKFFIRRWGAEGRREEVRFVIVVGHGHEWPGSHSPLPESMLGPSVDFYDATADILAFFRQHPKP